MPAEVARRALRKLDSIHAAVWFDDLRVPPGNRLHAPQGDRAGQHVIRLNDQWLIRFRFEGGDVHAAEFCDYH